MTVNTRTPETLVKGYQPLGHMVLIKGHSYINGSEILSSEIFTSFEGQTKIQGLKYSDFEVVGYGQVTNYFNLGDIVRIRRMDLANIDVHVHINQNKKSLMSWKDLAESNPTDFTIDMPITVEEYFIVPAHEIVMTCPKDNAEGFHNY